MVRGKHSDHHTDGSRDTRYSLSGFLIETEVYAGFIERDYLVWVRVKAVFHPIPPWALNWFLDYAAVVARTGLYATQTQEAKHVAFEAWPVVIRSLNFINYTPLATKAAKFLYSSQQKPHTGTNSCPLFMGQIQLEINYSIVFHWSSHITEGLSASVRMWIIN